MKIILFLFAAGCYSLAGAQLTITPGTQFSINGNTQITLNNTDLINDGVFNAGTGMFSFSGNAINHIRGSQPIRFHLLEINKPTASSLFLQRDIMVTAGINFTLGFINLNGHNIDLGTAGLLNNENENSRIDGTSGGNVFVTTALNQPSAVNPGNLGAIITSSGNLGSVAIIRGHQAQKMGIGNNSSIFRYYDIVSSNNLALNATLRFSYFDGELNRLPESSLVLWRSDNNTEWIREGATSFNTVSNYVEKTSLASFSRFTLSGVNNALPVRFIFFNLQCKEDKTVLNWKTAQEQNSDRFSIEASIDAVQWKAVGNIHAAGNSSLEKTYSFIDGNPAQKIYYRIAQYDQDGKVYYSSILRSPCSTREFFTVWPNPFHSDFFIGVGTNSSSEAVVLVYDSRGALIKTAKTTLLQGMNQLSIDLPNATAGIYTVAVKWNGGKEMKVTQLVKK